MRPRSLLFGLLAGSFLLATAAPVWADEDDWRHEHNEHAWQEHEWHEHHAWNNGYSYYSPPVVVNPPATYYSPPPVYYGSPGVSFGVTIP
jgi:hypothetical protein